MQVYSTVEKDAQMNRTAQRIREIVLSRFSVYIRVYGEKNDETCRTHAIKNTFTPFVYKFILIIYIFYLKKDFCEKNVINTLLFA